MTPTEILIAARQKIDSPEKWRKGLLAVDEHDAVVCSADEKAFRNAARFCTLGAVLAVGDDCRICLKSDLQKRGSQGLAIELLFSAIKEIDPHFHYGYLGSSAVNVVSDKNDHKATTHDDLMRIFDRAIEISKKAP